MYRGGAGYKAEQDRRAKTPVLFTSNMRHDICPKRKTRYVLYLHQNTDKHTGLGQVRVHPLSRQFFKDAELITVSVCTPSDIDGRNWLHGRGEERRLCL